tara:strand:+ start:42 stop:308 length:267 start_codon:yes stop_codon:yes gene_type:complete
MVGINTQSVMALVENKLLRLYVASVNHVTHTMSKEVATCLLLTMLLYMDSAISGTVKTPLPLPAGCIKGAFGFFDFSHERIHPSTVCD